MTAAEARAINGRRILGDFTRDLAAVGDQGRLEGARRPRRTLSRDVVIVGDGSGLRRRFHAREDQHRVWKTCTPDLYRGDGLVQLSDLGWRELY
jgi:hypothetical protein